MYYEISPAPALAEFVQSFWRIETDAAEDSQEEVEPDGCFDIVVYIRKNGRNKVYLTGIWDKPIMVITPSDSNIVGVRFYPVAVALFLRMTLAELKNLSCPFSSDMVYESAGISLDYLFTERNPDDIIAFLKVYLTLRLEFGEDLRDNYLYALLNAGLDSSVSAFSAGVGLSERQLNRKFSAMFGLPPKSYLNILRFIQARQLLRSGSEPSLAGIAAAAGYSDQAHFTREFKKYSGKTPGKYLRENV